MYICGNLVLFFLEQLLAVYDFSLWPDIWRDLSLHVLRVPSAMCCEIIGKHTQEKDSGLVECSQPDLIVISWELSTQTDAGIAPPSFIYFYFALIFLK